jgi:nucleoside 2-deoxyribosyltransferase
MKYYIATSLLRIADHNLVRDAFSRCGYELSYDWTLHGSVQQVSIERLKEVATLELNAIVQADFVVVLLPGGKGTHVELGFAIGNNKKIFLHSEDGSLFDLGPQTNAFYHHSELIRLCCPLVDVADRVHSNLSNALSPIGSG